MGLAQFVQQFVDDGRFYLNRGYRGINASTHIHTRAPEVYVGEQWIDDLEQLNARLSEREGEVIPTEKNIWDKGIDGPFVDATAPTSEDGRGWA